MATSSARPEPTFVNLARDAFGDDMLGLFAAGEEVASLLAHPGWEHVVRVVGLEVAGIDSKLGRLLDSRAEYAHCTGRRAGLGGFEQAAHAIVAESARKLAEQKRKYEGASEYASLEA